MKYFEIIANGASKYFADLWDWQGVRVLAIVLAAALADLIGSICCTVIVPKRLYHDDIRLHDGADMLSLYGVKGALLAFAGDFFKGILAAALGVFLFGCIGGYVAVLFAVLGDAFPVFFHFKGGKGFAPLLGASLLLNSHVFFVILLIFAGLIYVSKYAALGPIMASAVWPLLLSRWGSIGGILIGFGNSPVIVGTCTLLAMVTAALVVILHRKNLARMLKGAESKIDFAHVKKQPEERK